MSGSNQEAFQSMATVFILENKTWIERGSGLVRFVFDLNSFALRLVIRPGTPQQLEVKLRPRIRSKGPRAYVVRAQAENGSDEHILAVRFEREEDSRSFRRFVEKRDVDKTPNKNNNSQITMTSSPSRKNTNYSTSNSAYHPMNNSINPRQHIPRSASNIAHNNGYNGYNQPQAQSYGYNAKMTSYFWTCPACFQMVDPSLTACQICGTLREPMQHNNSNNNNNVLQPMPNYPNNPQHNVLSYHPQQQQPPTFVNPFQIAHAAMNGGFRQPLSIGQVSTQNIVEPYHVNVDKPVPIIKLTSANLDRHNSLYPTKRKSDKESLLKKLIIVNCQQAVVV